MNSINFGIVPTYDALLGAYPSLGAALAALPAGTRFYVEDQMCEVRRSANGTFWVPEGFVGGPIQNSPANQVSLYGPAGALTLSTTASQTRTLVRPTFYQFKRPPTIKGFKIYIGTAGVVGATTSGFDVRLYECYPNGMPIFGRAPLYVWSYNADGSGTGATGIGTGTPGVLDLTAGTGTWAGFAAIGGNREAPNQFWIGTRHDFTTTAPTLTTVSQNSFTGDSMPFITPTDGTSTLSHANCYSWTESTFTLGEFAVWNAAAEMVLTGVGPHVVLVDMVA